MVVLQAQQVEHAERLASILGSNGYALDLSVMGAGKTYTAVHLALREEFAFQHVVVVCPVSVQPKWVSVCEEFGVSLACMVSYQGLRSRVGKQPAHGLLQRIDVKVLVKETEYTRVRFSATAKLETLVANGALLIVDEVQHVKNLSAQFEAVKSVIAAFSANSNSKCLLMSGSPFDKKQHAVALFRTLGVMQADEVSFFDIGERQLVETGIAEIVKACERWDLEGSQELHARYGSDAYSLAYQLFVNIAKPAIASNMPCPPTTAKVHKFSAFYPLAEPETLKELEKSIHDLANACGYDRVSKTVNFAIVGERAAMAQLNRALQSVEAAKLSTMICAAKAALQSDTALKVVMCVNYTASIGRMRDELAEYQPLVLNGAVAPKARAKVIAQFQVADSSNRLLLGNCSVCSVGIDLDDRHGAFPRLCLVSPNYSTLGLHQLGHRFLRANTKGDSTFHMFYIKEAHEICILHALAKKGSVMKEICPSQVEDGVLFPGDYPVKTL